MTDNQRNEILEYIPQRPPMVMVDALTAVSDGLVVCQLKVRDDTMFVADGKLRESGIIENIAQTIAAGAGYKAKNQNQDVKLGYIAAIKKLTIFKLPSTGETLTTTARVVNEVFSVTIVQAEVKIEETLIAECEMRIFVEDR